MTYSRRRPRSETAHVWRVERTFAAIPCQPPQWTPPAALPVLAPENTAGRGGNRHRLRPSHVHAAHTPPTQSPPPTPSCQPNSIASPSQPPAWPRAPTPRRPWSSPPRRHDRRAPSPDAKGRDMDRSGRPTPHSRVLRPQPPQVRHCPAWADGVCPPRLLSAGGHRRAHRARTRLLWDRTRR